MQSHISYEMIYTLQFPEPNCLVPRPKQMRTKAMYEPTSN